jgi:hypothetical protein
MYGLANGNDRNATQLCQENFPDKNQPTIQSFSAVYCQLA